MPLVFAAIMVVVAAYWLVAMVHTFRHFALVRRLGREGILPTIPSPWKLMRGRYDALSPLLAQSNRRGKRLLYGWIALIFTVFLVLIAIGVAQSSAA